MNAGFIHFFNEYWTWKCRALKDYIIKGEEFIDLPSASTWFPKMSSDILKWSWILVSKLDVSDKFLSVSNSSLSWLPSDW